MCYHDSDEMVFIGLPESFNVMVKELQSLCLNVELLERA
jgi:DNA-directed RNA polymerase beta subunit